MRFLPYQKSLEGRSKDEIYAHSRQLIAGVVAVRSSDQSVNWVGLFGALVLIVGTPIVYMTWLNASLDADNSVASRRSFERAATLQADGFAIPGSVNPSTVTPSSWMRSGSASSASPTPYPTYTPLPTYTPYPTPEPTPYGEIVAGQFSFYDPLIGKDKPEISLVNCPEWNTVTQDCDGTLRSGDDFRDWYNKAAACTEELYLQRAQFVVVSPDWLVKLFPNGFICLDTGGAVKGLFYDFLIRWQDMPMAWEKTPWGSAVILRRVK